MLTDYSYRKNKIKLQDFTGKDGEPKILEISAVFERGFSIYFA